MNKKITSGNTEIDKKFACFAPGQLFVLAGRPMIGKMAFMLSIASACSADVPTLFFNLDLYKDNLENQNNLGFTDVFDNPSYLLKTEFSKLLLQKEYALVVVNYIQLLPSISELNMAYFKEMAIENNTCIVLILQLDRTCEERTDSKPRLADVKRMFRYSEQFLKYTDGIIGVYNINRDSNTTADKLQTIELVRLAKNKKFLDPTKELQCLEEKIDVFKVREAYGELYYALRTFVNNRNPMNFYHLENSPGEYNPEVATIIIQLRQQMTKVEIHDLVVQEFKRWFGEGLFSNVSCMQLSNDIYTWLAEVTIPLFDWKTFTKG
jgi:hypothetical protein